jgi:hypothetical protein
MFARYEFVTTVIVANKFYRIVGLEFRKFDKFRPG